MARKTPGDATAPPPEETPAPPPTDAVEPTADDDAVFLAAEEEVVEMGQAQLAIEVHKAKSERLNAYSEILWVLLAAQGFPVRDGMNGDAVLYHGQSALDKKVESACRRATLAMLKDAVALVKDDSLDAAPEGSD